MFKFLKSYWMKDQFAHLHLYRKLHGGVWKEYLLFEKDETILTIWVPVEDDDYSGVLKVLNEETYD